jgi:hypothetical protein
MNDGSIMPTSSTLQRARKRCVAIVAASLLPVTVLAWQAVPPPRQAKPPVWILTPPPAAVQFQQSAQQQQLRDQLQKSQLQSSLHQSVSDQSRRVGTQDASTRARRDQTDQAQLDRDRAAQQDLLDRSSRAVPPPPVPHLQPVPAPASSR